jgi:hypothetical protein
MNRLGSTLAAVALLFGADASGVLRAPNPAPLGSFSTLDASLAQPEAQSAPAKDEPAAGSSQTQTKSDHSKKSQSGPLKDDTKLTLVRYVDGELVRVVRSIPSGKKGFHVKAGAPLDERALRIALASAGSAINPGDRAQVTDLEFKDKQIIVDVNGGGKGRTRLRDRIHLEVGGSMPTMSTSTTTSAPVNLAAGATIFLDFDKSVPDMTPEELERYLAGLLDFSKRHSAAVQWVETLPPEIQKAIEEKQPAVGMDRDMILAALGKPDRKVREKSVDGIEIEDWIYGTPPEKTIFVSFEGDKVTQVRQYPQ